MRLIKLGCRAIPFLVASFLTLFGVGASAQTRPVRARITEAVDETNLVQLRGNVHPLARAEFDQGVVDDAQPMKRVLLLLQRSPEQQAALSALMDEQLTKGSPNYHRWLTPEEFGKQFGPADKDIQRVKDWLGGHGFQEIKMGPGHMVMEFTGTAGLVRNAFHTEIHHYAVNSEAHMANASDPQIPAALAPVVRGIRSLHNFKPKSHLHSVGTFRWDKDTGKIEPLLTTQKGCGTSGSQPCFAVTPADFFKIYGMASGSFGQGQVIAIVADSNIKLTDFGAFQSLFGAGTNINVILDGPDPGLNDDEGEADLDVEWSSAVASEAIVDLVVSESTTSTAGFDLSALYIVEHNLPTVMSESFGVCEAALGAAGNAFYNTLWEQAAAQGITVMVSSGDGGSDGCDDFNTATVAISGIAVSGTASTPFNVSVGGTDFDDAGKQSQFWNMNNGPGFESALGYIPETTWNDSCAETATAGSLGTCNPGSQSMLNIVSGSGGPSAFNPKPTWQNGVTPADGFRDIPDVSLFASNGHNGSFYVVCQADAVQTPSSSCTPSGANGSFSFVGVGGTSASAPAFAGIMAIVNSAGTAFRQGNVNPILYRLAQTQKASTSAATCNSSNQTNPKVAPPAACVFNDITKGNDSVPCAGGSKDCSSKTTNTNGVLVTNKVPAFTTGPGYDLATGLGSVNVVNLLNAWFSFESGLKPTATSVLSTVPPNLVGISHGTQVTFNIKVAPNPAAVGTPSGEVSILTDTNFGAGAAALDGTGMATITTNSLPVGAVDVSAEYSGDATFRSSASMPTIPVRVTPEQSQLKIAILSFDTGKINSPSLVYGSNYILRAEVAGTTTPACQPILFAPANNNTQGCATGTITITDNGSTAPPNGGTFALNILGHTENQPIQLSVGSHTLSATYSGDSSYTAPASSSTATVRVTQAATTTAVTANPASITSGGTVTLTATISTQSSGDAPGAPGGKLQATPVQFLNGTTALTGTIKLTPSPGPANSASLTATLTTTVSAGIPDTTPPWRLKLPPGLFWLLALCALLYLLLLLKLPTAKRRGYAYAGLVVFALAAGGIVGCGGGGGGGSKVTTPQTKTVTITAKFAGDVNYTASTSAAATITVQ